MESFSFIEMWTKMGPPARAVVIILAIMSIYSLGVMGERLYTFLTARARSLRFVVDLGDLLKKRDLAGALARARQTPQPPIARVVAAALAEYAEYAAALHAGGDGASEIGDFDVVDAVNRALE